MRDVLVDNMAVHVFRRPLKASKVQQPRQTNRSPEATVASQVLHHARSSMSPELFKNIIFSYISSSSYQKELERFPWPCSLLPFCSFAGAYQNFFISLTCLSWRPKVRTCQKTMSVSVWKEEVIGAPTLSGWSGKPRRPRSPSNGLALSLLMGSSQDWRVQQNQR